ncbi:MAG: ferrochelatase, partial [Helicobacter sp.]|nr:ferrochelatase [Helicobacter sp.]
IGPVRWTKPFISEVLDELSGESVLVYPIAFSIDNSETDYELSIQYRQYAKEKDIKAYEVCACLNDSPLFVRAILNLIQH